MIDLEPVLEHVCVPEMSEHCYLTARVKNNTDYPLLAGDSSIFLNNNFITKSKVDNVAPTEELVVSLGADPQVCNEYHAFRSILDQISYFLIYEVNLQGSTFSYHSGFHPGA